MFRVGANLQRTSQHIDRVIERQNRLRLKTTIAAVKFVGDAKFCILVDESLHVSHKEQMTIILRFVDEERYVRERFFKIVSVKDITSINLKEQICLVLSTNKLQMQNIRVSSTKTLLQALRDDGWANFLLSVQQFVDDHGLEMPNMGAAYSMEKFYPGDFDASEVRALRLQLEHYKCQVASNKDSLGARVPGKSSTLHPPLPACGLASWLLACLWMMSSILHMYQELGEAEVVSCIPKYDFQFVKQAALPSRADDVNTLSGCFCGFGDIEVISAGHRKRDIRIFTDYCRTRSDCREASRRTKDVSTKYEHVNKFWVVTAISQCADLKVKYSEILNNKQSEESFIMKVLFRCCPFIKAETSMSYSTMHSRMENLESLAWEIQKTRFQFDRIYAPTIKDFAAGSL
ncbi:hypothetical protein POM88_004421 [Heracleum sosnowskyi]|uniref:DUF4371 domain-containing protein n=1 Tax=Heracleum sosnowskyi TaxID=360622 RepID=A0AAD8JLF1_9APIA|nr:hypothetical protein POM88_004421 [Heracleum sosnowskyi]